MSVHVHGGGESVRPFLPPSLSSPQSSHPSRNTPEPYSHPLVTPNCIYPLNPSTLTHRVDLILAMQAPIRLERMLPHIVALGVGRLVIVGASKVLDGYEHMHTDMGICN